MVCIFFLLPSLCKAQAWKYSLPAPTNDYYYRTAEAKGETEEIAEQKAIAKLISEVCLSKGMDVKADSILKVVEKGGSFLYGSNKAFDIPINKVCCKIEKNAFSRGYSATILCQVAFNTSKDGIAFAPFDCNRSREIKK